MLAAKQIGQSIARTEMIFEILVIEEVLQQLLDVWKIGNCSIRRKRPFHPPYAELESGSGK